MFYYIQMFLSFGIAATGFAILFNVPKRTLPTIFFIAAFAGLIKMMMIQHGYNLVVATFSASLFIGFVCIPIAHLQHAPPLVFSIPSVIPLVPGVLAFRMMVGIIQLSGDMEAASYAAILSTTVSNGLKVMFVLLSLAAGVALPMLLTRKDSVKHVRLRKKPFTSAVTGE
ncbi:threonine/serine exporter family protein [Aridibaculum aurantiacum]|uniref:threonine/serine exporter family protein n=1 Tax=Aridibaculum aurantiacum TaxID=2810307 RepID=UPI001A9631EC